MMCIDTSGKEEILIESVVSTKRAALDDFKAGVVQSMKQYNACLVKTFDSADDFLADLRGPD